MNNEFHPKLDCRKIRSFFDERKVEKYEARNNAKVSIEGELNFGWDSASGGLKKSQVFWSIYSGVSGSGKTSFSGIFIEARRMLSAWEYRINAGRKRHCEGETSKKDERCIYQGNSGGALRGCCSRWCFLFYYLHFLHFLCSFSLFYGVSANLRCPYGRPFVHDTSNFPSPSVPGPLLFFPAHSHQKLAFW